MKAKKESIVKKLVKAVQKKKVKTVRLVSLVNVEKMKQLGWKEIEKVEFDLVLMEK